MFTRLYRILLTAVLSIGAFFILTSLIFSSRLNEDFIPKTWKYRWLLLDGILSILYLIVFSAIAWLWRPTGNNRNLGLSDELPTFDGGDDGDDVEEEDLDEAEEFEVEDTEGDGRGGKSVRMKKLRDDSVVFDVGDEDDDDDEESGVGMESRRLKGHDGSDDDEDEGAPPSYRG